jgi:hypothetical protein
MNIASNPWSFTSADVPAAVTAAASPTGMVQQGTTAGQQGLASVLLTTTGAHGLTAGQWITYIGDTNGRFNGFYKVVFVPSATTALLQSISSPTSGSPISTIVAASGGGSVLVCVWPWMIRAEDISVMATSAAPGATLLTLLDRNGNIVWNFIGVATAEGFVSANRGKPLWIDGLTLQLIPTGCIVEVTVN